MNELISIIIPIYNVELYLRKCIESVINQSYSNLEIILVNDGSPDRCGEICNEYAERDSRIKVIHKENGGLSDARNSGINIAKGKYIGFVDSDDYIHKDMYKVLYELIKNTDSKIAICDRYLAFEDGSIKYENSRIKNSEIVMDSEEALLKLNSYSSFDMAAWNKLYDRELFNDIKFPVGLLCEDYYVIYRLFHLAKKIVYKSEPLYYYLQRQGSISGNIKAYEAYIDASKKQLEFIEKNYPNIKSIAHSAVAFAYIGSYNFYIYKNIKFERENEYRSEVRKKIPQILKCKEISVNKKIQSIIFTYNMKLYNLIMKKIYNTNEQG